MTSNEEKDGLAVMLKQAERLLEDGDFSGAESAAGYVLGDPKMLAQASVHPQLP